MRLKNGMKANRFGLPFDVYLARALDGLIKRINKKKAGCLIIDGSVGEGKTTLAVHCADYLNGAYHYIAPLKLDPFVKFQGFYELKEENYIQLTEQYGMGGEQFQEQLLNCAKKKYKVIIYDEAGDFARRGALTTLNQNLNRIFETYRTFKIILILCLPSVVTLDRDIFLKGVPRMLLHCQGRDSSAGFFKAYSLKKLLWMLHDMKTHPVPQLVYNKVTPNFTGLFFDLPADRSKQLEDISSAGKLNILEGTAMMNDKFISMTEIVKKYQITPNLVNNLMSSYGIQDAHRVNGIKYMNKTSEQMQNLLAHLERRLVKLKNKHKIALAKVKSLTKGTEQEEKKEEFMKFKDKETAQD